jgi:hypothetical protein
MTDQPTAEVIKYSQDRTRKHQHPTNDMLEVWQNSASFGRRLVGSAIEALLTKVVHWRSSVLLIVVFLVATAVSVSQPNSYSQHDELRV